MKQWETRDLIEVKNDWKRLAQEQAEKIEELMKWNDELQAELIEKAEKIEELQKENEGQAEKIDHLKGVIKKYDVALDNEKNSQTEK
jgi:predicted nuclease with TOPRIM domain